MPASPEKIMVTTTAQMDHHQPAAAAAAATDTATATTSPSKKPAVDTATVSLIEALRNLFRVLSDSQFESECEMERKRRYGHTQEKFAPPPTPTVAASGKNNSNRKRPPPPAAAAATSAASPTVAIEEIKKPRSSSKKQKTLTTDATVESIAAAAATAGRNNFLKMPPPAALPAPPARFETVYERQWNERYAELYAYRCQYGHVQIPADTPDENLASLRRWILKLRCDWNKYLKGERSPLDAFRIQRLVYLGLGTSIEQGPTPMKEMNTNNTAITTATTTTTAALPFFTTNRNTTGGIIGGTGLLNAASFGSSSKTSKKKAAIALSKNDKSSTSAGTTTTTTAAATKRPYVKKKQTIYQHQWMDSYEQLRAFHVKYGHVKVPHNNDNFAALYKWTSKTKSAWRKTIQGETRNGGGLNDTQIEMLIQLGLGSKQGGPAGTKEINASTKRETTAVLTTAAAEQHNVVTGAATIDTSTITTATGNKNNNKDSLNSNPEKQAVAVSASIMDDEEFSFDGVSMPRRTTTTTTKTTLDPLEPLGLIADVAAAATATADDDEDDSSLPHSPPPPPQQQFPLEPSLDLFSPQDSISIAADKKLPAATAHDKASKQRAADENDNNDLRRNTTDNNNNNNSPPQSPLKASAAVDNAMTQNAVSTAEQEQQEQQEQQQHEERIDQQTKLRQQWDAKFVQLESFRNEYGHVLVSKTDHPAHVALASWLHKQKFQWRRTLQGETKKILSQDRIDRLISIGVGTRSGPIDYKSTTWDDHFKELVAFKKVHGHCEVSESTHKATHLKLAVWCTSQRKAFQNRTAAPGEKRRAAVMIDSQLEQLASVSFRFANKQIDFDERIFQLQEYKKLHGHTRVPVELKEYSRLGSWVACIKHQHKKNTLPPEQVAKLEEIGMEWTGTRGRPKGTTKGGAGISSSKSKANSNNNNKVSSDNSSSKSKKKNSSSSKGQEKRRTQASMDSY